MTCVYCKGEADKPKDMNICTKCWKERFVIKQVKKIKK